MRRSGLILACVVFLCVSGFLPATGALVYVRTFNVADVTLNDNGVITDLRDPAQFDEDRYSSIGPLSRSTPLLVLPAEPQEAVAKAQSIATADYGDVYAYGYGYGQMVTPHVYGGKGTSSTAAQFADVWNFTPNDPALMYTNAHMLVTFEIEGQAYGNTDARLRTADAWWPQWECPHEWAGTTTYTFDHVMTFGSGIGANYHVDVSGTGNQGEYGGSLYGLAELHARLTGIEVRDDQGQLIPCTMSSWSGHDWPIVPEPTGVLLMGFAGVGAVLRSKRGRRPAA